MPKRAGKASKTAKKARETMATQEVNARGRRRRGSAGTLADGTFRGHKGRIYFKLAADTRASPLSISRSSPEARHRLPSV